MARKLKFITVSNLIKLLPVITTLGMISLGYYAYTNYQDLRAERNATLNSGSTKNFSATNIDNQDSPEKRMSHIYSDLSELKIKMEKNDSDKLILLESKKKLSETLNNINANIATIANAVSDAARQNDIQDSRIERLEKLIKKLAQGGDLANGAGVQNQQRTDGASLSQSGVAVYGDDSVIADNIVPTNLPNPNQSTAPSYDYYIPSGSRVRIELTNYVFAPAGGLQQLSAVNTPGFPAFARILDDIELPDGSIIPLSNEGIVQLSMVGDATNERAMPRIKTLRFYDGVSFYELGATSATVMDAVDNAPGFMGTLDTNKRSAEIAKAAVLQGAKMFSKAIAAAGGIGVQNIPRINPTTGTVTAPKLNFGAIGWSSAGSSLDKFINFFMNKASTYFDVVHVSDKIAVEGKDHKIKLVPHQAYLIFTDGIFVKKVQ